jgi:hypothetical protein
MNDAQEVPATDDARFIRALILNWRLMVDPLMRASGVVVEEPTHVTGVESCLPSLIDGAILPAIAVNCQRDHLITFLFDMHLLPMNIRLALTGDMVPKKEAEETPHQVQATFTKRGRGFRHQFRRSRYDCREAAITDLLPNLCGCWSVSGLAR